MLRGDSLWDVVSIQLVSPASGDHTGDIFTTVFAELVSIQLVSPASGDFISI